MMNWERFNRSNACPICNGERKDCRRNTVKNLIHCRSAVEPPTGWKFVKEDSEGFGIFAPQRDNWNPDQWKTYHDKQIQLKKVTEKKDAERQAQSLKPQVRDKHYRQLLADLPLHPADQADLIGRGLTDQQIAEWGFKSVGSWQRLDQKFPIALPGVNFDGKSLNTPKAGYLCPIPDINDRIVGAQLRIRNPGKDEHRYLWLTSANKRNPNGQTPHVSGELPLGVYRPIGKQLGIALVEGLGVKPRIASVQGWIVIGAAGGNWLSAEKQFKAYLKRLSTEAGTKLITLFPDAGDVENPQVCQRWEREIAKLIQWGYSVQVAWWEQITKLENDIDEITPEQLKAIRYLTPQQFRALYQVDENEFLTPKERWELETKQIQAKLNALTLTPEIEICEQYLPDTLPMPLAGMIQAINSPCNTGKTSHLKRITQWHRREYPTSHRYLLGYRNGLLLQTGQRVGGFDHLHESDMGKYTETYLRTATDKSGCLDSIERLIPLDSIQPNSILFLDEGDAIIKHGLEGGTLGSDRHAKILDYFGQVARRILELGGRIVVLEDNLTDLPLNLLTGLTQAKLQIIRNTYQEWIWDVEIGSGSLAGFILQVLERLSRGEKVLIPTTSQLSAERIERIIRRYFPEKVGYRLDSLTAEEPWAKRFQEFPDDFLAETQPDFLIYSPTAESGLDICSNHFDRVMAMIFHLETRQAIQLLSRLRVPVPRHIFCLDRAPGVGDEQGRAKRPNQLLKEWEITTKQAILLSEVRPALMAELEADPNDEEARRRLNRLDELGRQEAEQFWNRHIAFYQARVIGSQAELKKRLVEALKARSHNVTEVAYPKDDGIQEQLKEIKAEIELERAEAIASADPGDITPMEASIILASPNSTQVERLSARKCLLNQQLPGASTNDSGFVLRVVVQRRGQYLKATTLLWMLQKPEVASYLDRMSLKSQLDKPFVVYRRVQNNRAKVNLMMQFRDLLQSVSDGREYSDRTVEVQTIKEIAIKSSSEIYRLFKLQIKENQSASAIANKLLRTLGFETEEARRPGSEKRYRIYRVANADCTDRIEISEALKRKWAELLEAPSKNSSSSQDQARDLYENFGRNQENFDSDRLEVSRWLTPECLADIRSSWSTADCEEVRQAIQSAVPAAVLKVALDGLLLAS
jgi:hypothetical protein